MSDVELGRRFIGEAHEMIERGQPDAAAVLMALAGAVMEGPAAVSELAGAYTDFCLRREAALPLPDNLRDGLRANFINN